MQFKINKSKKPVKDYTEWHKWFAWYPVMVKPGDTYIVWLESVERRIYIGYLSELCTDYRFESFEKANALMNYSGD